MDFLKFFFDFHPTSLDVFSVLNKLKTRTPKIIKSREPLRDHHSWNRYIIPAATDVQLNAGQKYTQEGHNLLFSVINVYIFSKRSRSLYSVYEQKIIPFSPLNRNHVLSFL